MTRCPAHGRPLRDASLCSACVTELERNLADLAAYCDELVTMLTRQDRVPRTMLITRLLDDEGLPVTARVQPLPFDETASRVLLATRNALVGWVRTVMPIEPIAGPVHQRCSDLSCLLIAARQWPANTLPAMCRWLLKRVPAIRMHDEGQALLESVADMVEAARKAIDLRPDLWFAGVCNAPLAEGARCDERLYAEMSAGKVECSACGVTHDVAERRTDLLAAAEDQLETATHLARALTRLGEPVTPERVRKWRERGRLAEHGVDVDGHPTYRVGDVIDLLEQDRERAERRAG